MGKDKEPMDDQVHEGSEGSSQQRQPQPFAGPYESDEMEEVPFSDEMEEVHEPQASTVQPPQTVEPRRSERVRSARDTIRNREDVFGPPDLAARIAFHLNVHLCFADLDQIPQRPNFMHTIGVRGAPDARVRWRGRVFCRQFLAAMRLGMTCWAWRSRIFGLGPYHRATYQNDAYDALGMFSVNYIVESSRLMMLAMRSSNDVFDTTDNVRACLQHDPALYNSAHVWGFMNMASLHLHQHDVILADWFQELLEITEERMGNRWTLADRNLYQNRLHNLHERRWLNLRYIAGFIFLCAFVVQGLHLRPEESQERLIHHWHQVMFQFHQMADWNWDYCNMYNTVMTLFQRHVGFLIRQQRPYNRLRNPYRRLLQMTRRSARMPGGNQAMQMWDHPDPHPFWMMNLNNANEWGVGTGTSNRLNTLLNPQGRPPRDSDRPVCNFARRIHVGLDGLPHVPATGYRHLWQDIDGLRSYADGTWSFSWHGQARVIFYEGLRIAMGGRSFWPTRSHMMNLGVNLWESMDPPGMIDAYEVSGHQVWNDHVLRWSNSGPQNSEDNADEPIEIGSDTDGEQGGEGDV